MINSAFFCGLPQEFENSGIKIYPPMVEDVVGNKYFHVYKQLLCTSQEEIEDQFNEKGLDMKDLITPLEQLFQLIYGLDDSEEVQVNIQAEEIAKKAFYFFTHEEVTFLHKQKIIVFGNLEEEIRKVKNVNELRMIGPHNFFNFQNKIRESCGEKALEPPNPNEDPRIKRIKAKARYRDKIKAKKGSGMDFGSTLVALCCMGIGLTPLNIGKISYLSVSPLVHTYQEKEKYEIDVRSLQAGAKKKDVNLKYWIRKIDD